MWFVVLLEVGIALVLVSMVLWALRPRPEEKDGEDDDD
jgi:hypothetical protein